MTDTTARPATRTRDATVDLPQRSSRGLVTLVAGLLALAALALLAAALGGVLADGPGAPTAVERLSVPVVEDPGRG